MVWQRVGGVDWLVVGAPEDRDGAELGVVLAHGCAHERPAETGIGAVAAAVLQRAVGRPTETPDHRVVEPSVAVRVGLQETVVSIRGEVAAVRLAAATLERLVVSPDELALADPPGPAELPWRGWGSELAAWFGAGPVSLAAAPPSPWTGDPAELTAFLRSLHPASGRAVVAWTDAPELVGALFPGPVPPAGPARRPLRWRAPAPTTAAGSTTASHVNNLLTVRVATTPLTEVALRLVVGTVHRGLVVLNRQVRGLEITAEAVDTDELCAVRAVPEHAATDWVQVRRSLGEALDAAASAPDGLLAEELDRARATWVGPGPVRRAVEALATGARPGAPGLPDALAVATVADLRAAVGQVLAGTLVSLPAAEGAPPGRPLFVPEPPAAVLDPTVRRRSRVQVRLRGEPDRQTIRADASTLQETLVPKRRSAAPGALQPVTALVDLTRLAARIDRGAELTTLVDRDDRRLTLVWPAYRRAAALRRLVDAATPPGARVQRGADPLLVAQLRRDLRAARVSWVLASVLLVVAVVLVVLHPVSGRGPEQQDVVTTVAVGQEVTLGNGSTVQVSTPTWTSVAGSTYPVLVVDVRYCGGGPTVDPDTGDDARNYLSPQRFDLTGIGPASRQVHGAPGVPLQETELADGQCTQGQVAFDIDADEPDGIVVGYHNGSGDRIGWALG